MKVKRLQTVKEETQNKQNQQQQEQEQDQEQQKCKMKVKQHVYAPLNRCRDRYRCS